MVVTKVEVVPEAATPPQLQLVQGHLQGGLVLGVGPTVGAAPPIPRPAPERERIEVIETPLEGVLDQPMEVVEGRGEG